MLTPYHRLLLAAKAHRSISTVNRRCRDRISVSDQSEAALREAAAELGVELPTLLVDQIEKRKAA
jgi:hypothetical protein